jgi:UDP-2,3-diacylglucosamine hydrolase
LASTLSQSSRKHTKDEKLFFGFENEWLYLFAKETLKHTHYDFFIFGHRHFPMALKLENSTYINLGEWLHFKTFLKIENNHPEMYQWKDGKAITYNPFDGSDV